MGRPHWEKTLQALPRTFALVFSILKLTLTLNAAHQRDCRLRKLTLLFINKLRL